jgi:hypothetical protein
LVRAAESQVESEVMAPDQSGEVLLMNAMDSTLNRLRVLAREMCPQDAAKLEAIESKAFNNLSEIAAALSERPHRNVPLKRGM